MNTVAEKPVTALTLPERAAVALGAAEYEIKIKAKVAASTDIVAVLDPAGRDQAHRIGMDLLKLRTGIAATSEAASKDAIAFRKAMIAKEKELIALITPEETRVFGLRDSWDAKIELEKQAKIAAERARMDAIKARIAEIRDMPLQVVGKSAEEIGAMIGRLAGTNLLDAVFEEFVDEACQTRLASMDQMAKAETAQRNIEIEAESRRQDAARAALAAEAERAELAELRAAAAKVAAEQAAEAKRLADLAAAQEAEAKRQRERAAAEQAERERVAAEAQAKANAELKAAQDKLNSEQAEFRAQQAAAQEAAILAQEIEIHHGQALVMNAEWEADRAAVQVAPVELVEVAAISIDLLAEAASATKSQLNANVATARTALAFAEKALADFIASPENNVFATMTEAEYAIENRLDDQAREDCKVAGNCGADEYTQEFIVDGLHYMATYRPEYNRHDKTYYYIDDSEFIVTPLEGK